MNKKVIFIAIAIVAFAGILIFLILRKTSPAPTQSSNTSSILVLPGAPQPPPSSLPLAQTVDEARSNAFVIALKDAQGNPLIADKNNSQQYILAEEKDYSIYYFAHYDSFLIQINSLPFDVKRKEAEQRFIQVINAPPEIACQLRVIVNTTQAVDPTHAGNNFHLSFCNL